MTGVSSSRKASWISGYPEDIATQPQGRGVCLRPGCVLLSYSPSGSRPATFCQRPFPPVLRTPGRLSFSPLPAASINSAIPSLLQDWLPSGAHQFPYSLPLQTSTQTPHIPEGFFVNTLGEAEQECKSQLLGEEKSMTESTRLWYTPGSWQAQRPAFLSNWAHVKDLTIWGPPGGRLHLLDQWPIRGPFSVDEDALHACGQLENNPGDEGRGKRSLGSPRWQWR